MVDRQSRSRGATEPYLLSIVCREWDVLNKVCLSVQSVNSCKVVTVSIEGGGVGFAGISIQIDQRDERQCADGTKDKLPALGAQIVVWCHALESTGKESRRRVLFAFSRVGPI